MRNFEYLCVKSKINIVYYLYDNRKLVTSVITTTVNINNANLVWEFDIKYV